MQTTYFIRKLSDNKIADIPVWGNAYTDQDGKERANELVEIHNKVYPNDKWYVSEERL